MNYEEKVSIIELNKLNKSLTILVGRNKITPTNIIELCTALMKIVELSNNSGRYKKELVIHTLKLFVSEKMKPKEGMLIHTFIDMFLPSVIDMIISVDKKKIKIALKKKIFKCCI
jgi:hypothetical protein